MVVGGDREVVGCVGGDGVGGVVDVDGVRVDVVSGGKLHPRSGTKPRFVLMYHPSCALSSVH